MGRLGQGLFEGISTMNQHIAPIPCKPWSLNGLSDRLIVSHYENNYGAAIRSNLIMKHRALEGLCRSRCVSYHDRSTMQQLYQMLLWSWGWPRARMMEMMS